MGNGPATMPQPMVDIPIRRTLPRLLRHRLRAFEEIGRECDGAIARLNLGLVRPYLVIHPDHVQHIIRAPQTYRREGMMWRPLARLQGNGIAGEGELWQSSRRILQPKFTARSINALTHLAASAVAESLDMLAARAAARTQLDLFEEMTRMMHRVLTRVFFSDQIGVEDSDRLGAAIIQAFQSLGARMLLPFVSHKVPLPGDGRFRRSVETADEIIYRLIRSGREESAADNLVGLLASAVDERGEALDDVRIRDDVVAMYVAGTETTALALTWLWLLADANEEVVARLTDEVETVVGDGPPDESHVPKLTYTKMVFQEVLRHYPGGWVLPRTVVRDDTIDGTALRRGDTVLLSPYLTHRMPAFWPEPNRFVPERFAPDTTWRRHKFAYFPFGAGVHQCLGTHFATMEAQLAVAGLLSRFRVEVVKPQSLAARATVALQPQDRVRVLLHRRR